MLPSLVNLLKWLFGALRYLLHSVNLSESESTPRMWPWQDPFPILPLRREAPPAPRVLSFQREQTRTSCGLHLCPSKSFRPWPWVEGLLPSAQASCLLCFGVKPRDVNPGPGGEDASTARGSLQCGVSLLVSSEQT